MRSPGAASGRCGGDQIARGQSRAIGVDQADGAVPARSNVVAAWSRHAQGGRYRLDQADALGQMGFEELFGPAGV